MPPRIKYGLRIYFSAHIFLLRITLREKIGAYGRGQESLGPADGRLQAAAISQFPSHTTVPVDLSLRSLEKNSFQIRLLISGMVA